MTTATVENRVIPEAVRLAGEEAERQRREILGESQPPAPTTGNPDPARQDDDKAKLEAEIKALEERRDTIQREISTLTGKYGSTLQSLNRQVSDLTEANQGLTVQVSNLTEELASARNNAGSPGNPNFAKPAATDNPKLEAIRKKYIDQGYDEAFADLQIETLLALVPSVTASPEPAKPPAEKPNTPPSTTTDAAIERARQLWAQIETLHPGAQAINADPKFLEWLKAGTDAVTGLNRLQAGEAAFNSGDTLTVARLCREYDEERKKTPPANGGTVQPSVEGKAQPRPIPAPGAPPDAGGQKPRISLKDFTAWETDMRLNPGKYTKDQVDARIKEFQTAASEGRVDW